MEIPVLTTARLVMRGFTGQDVEAMHQIMNGPDVLRYFPDPHPFTQEHVQQMISRRLAEWAERGYGLWAVESRAGGELMGRCGLSYIAEAGETEIDFILGVPFWGRGYATEAGRAALDYGFRELPLETIVGIVHPDNMASRHVLEKLGMRNPERKEYFEMTCLRYSIDRASFMKRIEGKV